MEKEKPKGNPRKRWILIFRLAVYFVLIASLCGVWSYYYIYPGHSMSYFSRFETSEEVVAFLHDNFDLQVTTSDEILTFMDAYRLEGDGCQDSIPRKYDFAGYVVDENVAKIINCTVPVWAGFPGKQYYTVRFYINTDDLLEYIGASWFCACI